MFPNIIKLQSRFFICYLLAVFIPIMLLSSMIYSYHSRQRTKDYITGKKNSLIIEQNYLESQLNSSSNYFNQLKSNYELQSLLKGIYASEREIVYVYNKQIYSLISSIFLYDSNISGVTLYTQNTNASARKLRFFERQLKFHCFKFAFMLGGKGRKPAAFSPQPVSYTHL